MKYKVQLNLAKHQGLGVWIKGDGKGEILNFRLESPKHLSYGARGDHFVKIDFTGWRYFELVEIESSAFSDYIWPTNSIYYVYDAYLSSLVFNNIDKLQLWYNNIPKGESVQCLISPIKALPFVTTTINNPATTIGDKKAVFPVQMKSGMYLEFMSSNDCILYGSKGEFLQKVTIKGEIPILQKGSNVLIFGCNGPKDVNARVQVTVIGEAEPFKIRKL